MNKRIYELLTQAGGQYGGENHLTGKTRVYTDDVDYEKFAELIVKECSYRCYLTGEYQMAYELSELYGFEFDFKKMMEEDDE